MNFNANPSEGGGNYIKLKGGETIQGILRGEPIEFEKDFASKEVFPVDSGLGKFRFVIEFIVSENGAHVSKTLEQGSKLYNDLKELAKLGYDLSETVIALSRTGSGQFDTKYSVVPMPTNMSEEQWAQIAAIPKQDIDPFKKKEGQPPVGKHAAPPF